jgi:hypothetical protein
MGTLYQVLNVYTLIAVVVFVGGLSLHLGRWFLSATLKRRYRGVTKKFEGGPDRVGFFAGVKEVLLSPITHFYRRANPSWNRGYMLYHIAIVIKAVGYALATVVVLPHMLLGHTIPDVAMHASESYNYSPGNVAAIIFGSGEELQAHFLFGDVLGTGFMWLTAFALVLAVVGNLHMVYTMLRNRGASAILNDIDTAARGIRKTGTPKWDRVAVRLIIFAIIWVDVVSRLHLVENIVFVHAALGVTLLLIFPFTYLFHMVYNVLALVYSARRRMARTVA